MDQIEKPYDESVAIRNQIIRANLRLVVSTAKRYMTPAHDIFELVSDGNMSLIRAVEKFDVSRGTMFFTYATVAIVNDFAHTISVEVRHRDRFLTSHTEILSNTETSDCEPHVKEAVWLWRKSYVKQASPLPGRARIADYYGPVRPQPQPEAAHVKATWGRDRRVQRSDPTNPVSGNT